MEIPNLDNHRSKRSTTLPPYLSSSLNVFSISVIHDLDAQFVPKRCCSRMWRLYLTNVTGTVYKQSPVIM